jgi:transposase
MTINNVVRGGEMPYVEGVNRNQTILLPNAVEDYVGPDDPVRAIEAFAATVPYAALGFRHAEEPQDGRPPYRPSDLLGLLLWGYLNRVETSRKLELATRQTLPVMWLLRNLRPDFKTISEFRRHNAKAVFNLVRHFAVWLREESLVDGSLVAIDGSKFRAVNSRDRNHTRESVARRISQIENRVREYLEELERQDQADEAREPAGGLKPGELREKIERLRERKDLFERMAEQIDEKGEQISETDPDSRRMKSNEGLQVCYNAQIAVDGKHKLIIVSEVTNAVNDQEQLSGMAIEAKEVLGLPSLPVVADRGYSNSHQIAACDAAGITTYIPAPKSSSRNTKKGLYTKDDFLYERETDTYRCPAGQILSRSTSAKQNGRTIDYYRTRACPKCPLRKVCTEGKHRRIGRRRDEDVLTAAHARARAHPELMRRRSATVEHPFGIIKRCINGGRFVTRGLTMVNAEFSLAVMAFNIKRLLKILGTEGLKARLAPA